MKKKFAICLMTLLVLTAGACSNGDTAPGQSAGPTGVAESAGSGGSASLDPQTGLPAMDGEQQESCDRYLTPLLYSNFFSGNYMSEPLSAEWGDSGIITIYQDLAGNDLWPGLVNDKYQVEASMVEDLLMCYFPFDQEVIRSLAGAAYDADTDAYTMTERGGGPRDIVVTQSKLILAKGNDEQNLLELHYELFGPDGDGIMKQTASGVTQVRLLRDGQYHYMSNELHFEAA